MFASQADRTSLIAGDLLWNALALIGVGIS
jgi:hypothetical protein